MRLFTLYRHVDATGVSGTGVVAEGAQFSDGRCVIRWLTETSSMATYASLDDVLAIHGHGGGTVVRWEQDQPTHHCSNDCGSDLLDCCGGMVWLGEREHRPSCPKALKTPDIDRNAEAEAREFAADQARLHRRLDALTGSH